MSDGIVCKVWNIKGGNGTKSSSAQLNDSLSYILNREKTNFILDFDDPLFDDSEGQLSRECKYIENDIKTVGGALVGTHNLYSGDVKEAVSEMMETKKFFGKLDGRAALHLLISLPEEESKIDNASKLMNLCQNVLKDIFPDNQAIFAVHTNTENLHIHCIINSVGLNGKKIHQDKKFIKNVLQPCVNKHAKEYGFNQNTKWTEDKKTVFIDNKIKLRQYIDLAIEKSNTFDDFVNELNKMGVSTRIGKYLSLSMDNMNKPIRSHRLGENYTVEAIINRIENRLEKLKVPDVSNVTYGKKIDDILTPNTVPLKKYKFLSPDEKSKVIKLLKMGRNPWRENQQSNWQLNNLANELNVEYRLSEYIKFYSKDGTVLDTLNGITSTQEILRNVKKSIRDVMKHNKPIIDIYNRMKEIERKAYLYEHKSIKDFRSEFVEYRNLTHRLENGYGKTFVEIGEFVEDVNSRLLYCDGQLQELSSEYREVRKYAIKFGYLVKSTHTLSDVVGVYDNYDDEKIGIFDADLYYIASKKTDNVVRVTKTPGVDANGNMVEEFKITILSKHGEELITFDSSNGKKEFSEKLKKYSREYGFDVDCKKYSSLYMAKDYAGLEKQNDSHNLEFDSPRTNLGQGVIETKSYTFTAALNIKSVGNRDGNHIIMNKENPMYMASLLTNDEYIRFTILNPSGLIEEVVNIPSFKNRNYKGYELINSIKDKYGFSDDLVSFENKYEADTYYSEQREKQVSEEIKTKGQTV